MKIYLRLIALLAVIGLCLVIFLLFRQASAPESAIIEKQRNRLSAGFDKQRMEKDPVYAVEARNRLQFLDFRQAVAYNNENKPDQAIAILQRLIAGEEAKNKGNGRGRSRGYLTEADYYEALKESYIVKHDQAEAEKAQDRQKQLRARAEEAKRRERREEGKLVETDGE